MNNKYLLNYNNMVTVNFKEDIKLTSNNYDTFYSFINDFVENNYEDSNIENEYKVASDMKNAELPESFISNFVKSYE